MSLLRAVSMGVSDKPAQASLCFRMGDAVIDTMFLYYRINKAYVLNMGEESLFYPETVYLNTTPCKSVFLNEGADHFFVYSERSAIEKIQIKINSSICMALRRAGVRAHQAHDSYGRLSVFINDNLCVVRSTYESFGDGRATLIGAIWNNPLPEEIANNYKDELGGFTYGGLYDFYKEDIFKDVLHSLGKYFNGVNEGSLTKEEEEFLNEGT